MKILIVGYGSMGRRRIRLLKQLLSNCEFICVDNKKDRLEQIRKDGYEGFETLSEAINQRPDMAFVCTSPVQHASIISQLITSHINLFSELNLVSDFYNEIIEQSQKENVKVFMSNTLLYDKQILAIEKVVNMYSGKYTYIYHVGQYLKDWHPWENYQNFFIGKKKTNGCREILAIQLPWITKVFGIIKKITVIRKKNTSLDIDFDDTYIITIEHENGNTGVFICDVLARSAVNYLEVMSEETHIRWNGTPETLFSFDCAEKRMKRMKSYDSVEHIDGYAETIAEEPYRDEIEAFLEWIFEGKKPVYSMEEDKRILDIIDQIEGII